MVKIRFLLLIQIKIIKIKANFSPWKLGLASLSLWELFLKKLVKILQVKTSRSLRLKNLTPRGLIVNLILALNNGKSPKLESQNQVFSLSLRGGAAAEELRLKTWFWIESRGDFQSFPSREHGTCIIMGQDKISFLFYCHLTSFFCQNFRSEPKTGQS